MAAAQSWLANKRIVVIGGTTGIGLSAALAFIREGANVSVLGLDDESTKRAAGMFGKNGVAFSGDATRSGISQKVIDACVNQWGGCDGLFHVAGGSGRKWGDGPLHDLTLEGWDRTLALNLTSLMLSNQAAVNHFLKQKKGGTILNIGSVLGHSPSPKHFVTHAYAAAKSAATGFSRSIASYYAKDNIRVNVIEPGLVDTPMSARASSDETITKFVATKQPLDGGRLGLPGDIDGAAVYFMSDLSGFTTGQVLAVDGGWEVTEGQYGA